MKKFTENVAFGTTELCKYCDLSYLFGYLLLFSLSKKKFDSFGFEQYTLPHHRYIIFRPNMCETLEIESF